MHSLSQPLRCCGPDGWAWGIPPLVLGAIFRIPFTPVAVCCPERLTKHYSLELNRDTIVYHSASNDCCCHIAYSKQTLAIDKVNDVQIIAGCWETCFGLKKLQVESQGTEDIITAAIAEPDVAREAILLATRQFRDLRAPGAQAMIRGGGNMQARLTRLNQLVESNVMTAGEAAKLKPSILSCPVDQTERLLEAQSLLKQGLVNQDEFAIIKTNIISQL